MGMLRDFACTAILIILDWLMRFGISYILAISAIANAYLTQPTRRRQSRRDWALH